MMWCKRKMNMTRAYQITSQGDEFLSQSGGCIVTLNASFTISSCWNAWTSWDELATYQLHQLTSMLFNDTASSKWEGIFSSSLHLVKTKRSSIGKASSETDHCAMLRSSNSKYLSSGNSEAFTSHSSPSKALRSNFRISKLGSSPILEIWLHGKRNFDSVNSLSLEGKLKTCGSLAG